MAVGAAAAAAGYRARRRLQKVKYWFRPAAETVSLAEFDDAEAVDVCIIGSGPAGAVLGSDLARQGLRTIILESGFDLSGEVDQRVSQLDSYRASGPIPYPLVATRLRALGGTSNLWTGRCERLHPIDFERNAYTPEGAAWPIRYSDLEPYYERAERTLRVAGGELSQFHAPRNAPLPYPSRQENAGLVSLAAEIGITVDDVPSSVGEWADGPVRASFDLLPQFTKQSSATLITGATATRLIAESDGTISAVEVRNLDQVTRMVRAKRIVVACGAIESARLLLLSKSTDFPDGIGNSHDLVGRYFLDHPHAFYVGTIDRSTPRQQYARTQQFYDAFKAEGLGSIFLVFQWYDRTEENFRLAYAMEMQPSEENRITLAEEMPDHFGNPGVDLHLAFSEKDLETQARAEALIYQIFADVGATAPRKQHDGWGHHHIGTVRMGSDPATSVLDANLRVHESPNLYVLSSGAFVTSGPNHPTIAITALAHRLAEHLARSAG